MITFQKLYIELPNLLEAINLNMSINRAFLDPSITAEEFHKRCKNFFSRSEYQKFNNEIFLHSVKDYIHYLQDLSRYHEIKKDALFKLFDISGSEKKFSDISPKERMFAVTDIISSTEERAKIFMRHLIEKNKDEKKKKEDLKAMNEDKLKLVKLKNDKITYVKKEEKDPEYYDDYYSFEDPDFDFYKAIVKTGKSISKENSETTEIKQNLNEAEIQIGNIKETGSNTFTVSGENTQTNENLNFEIKLEDNGSYTYYLLAENEPKKEIDLKELTISNKTEKYRNILLNRGYEFVKDENKNDKIYYDKEKGKYVAQVKDPKTGMDQTILITYDNQNNDYFERINSEGNKSIFTIENLPNLSDISVNQGLLSLPQEVEDIKTITKLPHELSNMQNISNIAQDAQMPATQEIPSPIKPSIQNSRQDNTNIRRVISDMRGENLRMAESQRSLNRVQDIRKEAKRKQTGQEQIRQTQNRDDNQRNEQQQTQIPVNQKKQKSPLKKAAKIVTAIAGSTAGVGAAAAKLSQTDEETTAGIINLLQNLFSFFS
ncbi:MAG: hypothetical protein UR27_C0016G0004 [Candidatus Peregrinibacteria bacterium GW2011_GWA2_33_10]|nr:MAG: hypothetical protein UR27_C0016G0004 [Candidatus Peregrinibacteria bacterium GW2011_GWA2_33_10]KKP38490.1 MAG: hypothetical protein UR30_C0018G0017 [Candidatus Peregrinibacteria bacterium GW2011_GWC2_33_13]OGJ50030.1 MAG: hypothetical protein A2229_04285 [Candidatus Peregrinibacteria bacterium RIFOXYA2_FULL_33_7]